MTDKPIDLTKGGGGDEPRFTTVPVDDPAVEAFLLGRPAVEDHAEPMTKLSETAQEPSLTATEETVEGAPSSEAPKQMGVKERLFTLFRKPARVLEDPAMAEPQPALDAGKDPEPESAESAQSAPQDPPEEKGEVLSDPNLADLDPATVPVPKSRFSGVVSRLLRPKGADQLTAEPDADQTGSVATETGSNLAATVADPIPTVSGTISSPKDRFLGRMRRAKRHDGPEADPDPSGPGDREVARKGLSARRKGGGAVRRGFPPIQILIGWVGESSRRDVLAHARGFATDHIETLDTAWIAMAEFRGGTLFEIHEGGAGRAYLPELIEAISRDPDQVLWVPSGTKLNRVVTFSIVEGRPFSMMLNEADSTRVRNSGQVPVERIGRMRRLSPRGNAILVVGSTLFAASFSVLSASAFLSASVDQQPVPSLSYNAEILPHGQIVSLSDALREDRWVSRILFENGAWRAEFETFEDLVLPDDTGEAQQVIDEAVERNEILQRERDRKVRELRGE